MLFIIGHVWNEGIHFAIFPKFFKKKKVLPGLGNHTEFRWKLTQFPVCSPARYHDVATCKQLSLKLANHVQNTITHPFGWKLSQFHAYLSGRYHDVATSRQLSLKLRKSRSKDNNSSYKLKHQMSRGFQTCIVCYLNQKASDINNNGVADLVSATPTCNQIRSQEGYRSSNTWPLIDG